MTLGRFTELVENLVALNVPRDKAEAAVRQQLQLPPEPIVARDPAVLEKPEQNEVRKRFIVCGFNVRSLSQPRATKQSPGFPDLYIMHRELPIALWWETKRQVGGTYSGAQLDFKADCDRCGVAWQGGDRYDAEEYLISIGRAERVYGAFERIPWESTQ